MLIFCDPFWVFLFVRVNIILCCLYFGWRYLFVVLILFCDLYSALSAYTWDLDQAFTFINFHCFLVTNKFSRIAPLILSSCSFFIKILTGSSTKSCIQFTFSIYTSNAVCYSFQWWSWVYSLSIFLFNRSFSLNLIFHSFLFSNLFIVCSCLFKLLENFIAKIYQFWMVFIIKQIFIEYFEFFHLVIL